jgi:hypothetical protein
MGSTSTNTHLEDEIVKKKWNRGIRWPNRRGNRENMEECGRKQSYTKCDRQKK